VDIHRVYQGIYAYQPKALMLLRTLSDDVDLVSI
jgi:hypothetical protein